MTVTDADTRHRPVLGRADFDSDEAFQEYLDIEAADYSAARPANEAEKAFWKSLADQHINGEREKISLNIPKRNLSRIKAHAVEQGLPYQTLINAVLQQWLAKER